MVEISTRINLTSVQARFFHQYELQTLSVFIASWISGVTGKRLGICQNVSTYKVLD
jgi:hypothetical protein